MTFPSEHLLNAHAERSLLVCQQCEHFGGVATREPRLRVNCRQCRTCGPKQISPAYQACPVGKFHSGLRAANLEAKKVTTINLSQLAPLETLDGDALWNDHRVQFCARCAHCNRSKKECGQTGKKVWDAVNESCPLDRFRVHKGGFTGMVDGRGVGPKHPNYVAPRGPGQVQGKPDLTVTGAAEIGPMTPEALRGYFERVVVINLANRPERLTAFQAMLAAAEWPFREPEIMRVRHGDELGVPPWWRAGGGAWGCMLSHKRVLEDALRDDVQRLLVMEDDCLLRPGEGSKLAEFLARVPRDWQQIMFGGQLFGDSRQVLVNEQVRRVSQCERTHCYTLSRDATRSLWHWWQRPGNGGHCDHQMGDWQDTGIRVYAPTEFLAAQAEAHSDITGKNEPVRWWNGNGVPAAAVTARVPIAGPPRIWWHIACMGETWRTVVAEQSELLRRCLGTEDSKLAVAVGILGAAADREEAKRVILAAGLLPGPVYEADNLLEYEVPTMQMMWETARASRPGDGDEQYIYLHTKGVSTGDANKRAWRKLMEMFVVEKWKECREGLTNADVAGICWRGDPGEQYPHFAGNFWAARTSYLRRLVSPVDFSRSQTGSYVGHPWPRMSAEMWLGTGRPSVHESWSPTGGKIDLMAGRDWRILSGAISPAAAKRFPHVQVLDGPEYRKPEARFRNAIASLNLFGDAMPANFRSSLVAAAARWGCAYVEQTNPLGSGNWVDQKLLMDEHFSAFDRVVWVDRDIVIRHDCPSLFDVVPPGLIGAPLSEQPGHINGPLILSLMSRHNCLRQVRLDQYINSGVVVFSPNLHRSLFTEARLLRDQTGRDDYWVLSDQGLLSASIAANPSVFFRLPDEFCRCSDGGHRLDGEDRMGSFVLHFCGRKDRQIMDRVNWSG